MTTLLLIIFSPIILTMAFYTLCFFLVPILWVFTGILNALTSKLEAANKRYSDSRK